MNISKIRYHWEIFKVVMPKVDLQNRLMKQNVEFKLDTWFYQDDLNKLKKNVQEALDAINVIREELQK